MYLIYLIIVHSRFLAIEITPGECDRLWKNLKTFGLAGKTNWNLHEN
ncbi:hypothetical protein D1AOALGA4SA_3040 [Olavius algarvensis Delta 1 endosymbiont]|nr:hypothetical protein D1AOALGA4SA_3040 [Olavius algarvensis Delta 1 endosymbiont]